MSISSLKAIIDETPPEEIRRLAVSNYFPENPEKYTFKGIFELFVYGILVKRKVRKIRKEIRKKR